MASATPHSSAGGLYDDQSSGAAPSPIFARKGHTQGSCARASLHVHTHARAHACRLQPQQPCLRGQAMRDWPAQHHLRPLSFGQSRVPRPFKAASPAQPCQGGAERHRREQQQAPHSGENCEYTHRWRGRSSKHSLPGPCSTGPTGSPPVLSYGGCAAGAATPRVSGSPPPACMKGSTDACSADVARPPHCCMQPSAAAGACLGDWGGVVRFQPALVPPPRTLPAHSTPMHPPPSHACTAHACVRTCAHATACHRLHLQAVHQRPAASIRVAAADLLAVVQAALQPARVHICQQALWRQQQQPHTHLHHQH